MRFKLQLLLILPLLFTAGCATQQIHSWQVDSPYANPYTLEVGQIMHQATGRLMSEAELYDYLGSVRVIYVGESHDSVDDHAVQLKVIQALNERFPGKVAVGMEMLRTNFQPESDKWAAGEIDEKEFLRTWVKSWGNTFPYYKEILHYVRDNKMPLLAMNRPKSKMGMGGHGKGHKKEAEKKGAETTATKETAAAGQPAEEAKMPEPEPVVDPEIDYDDAYYNDYISAFFFGHGDGKPEIRKMFLKSQLLWDETMAQTGAEFLANPDNAGMKLVVLAGGNHVRYGIGTPRRLFRRLPVPYAIIDTVVIDFPEDKKDKLMTVDLPELPMPASDFKWAVNYTDLEDKRIMLGVGIAGAEPEGVLVKSVLPKSSAEEAGILTDDVIVDIDGVAIKEIFDLTYELGNKEPDTQGEVTVLRGEERLVLPVNYSTLKPHEEK
jgi:uncharacterized iron-regulated protein